MMYQTYEEFERAQQAELSQFEIGRINIDEKPTQNNLMIATISELAEHIAKEISTDVFENEFRKSKVEYDFSVLGDVPDEETKDLELLQSGAEGWYGIKSVDCGFDSYDLVLMADYYGGSCVSCGSLFYDMDKQERATEIERIIKHTLSHMETCHDSTRLIVEKLEV